MYDLPEIAGMTDALWLYLKHRLDEAGIAAPGQLTRGVEPKALWESPDLLLSQTCGFPLVTALAERLDVLATPAYRAEGCDEARYSSRIVAREGTQIDLDRTQGLVVAVNSFSSQSGWNALAATLAGRGVSGPAFKGARLTGAHDESLRAVREGLAELAAIDAVTWALLERHRPSAVAGFVTVGWTVSAPGLPLVVRASALQPTRSALLDALFAFARDAAAAPVRDALLIAGFVPLGIGAYQEIEAQRRSATAIDQPPIVS